MQLKLRELSLKYWRLKLKTIAFVCPWYGDDIPGGAEAALRSITSHLHESGLMVEILTTTVKEFTADWNIDYYKEGVTVNSFGVTVRRFKVRRRDVKAFDAVNYKLINGICISRDEEDIFNREMINSPSLYEYIGKHKEEYQCFVYIPYLFGTTYNGVAVCPAKSVLIPCFHDEGYAHMNTFAEMYSKAAGMLFNAQPELDLAKTLMDISGVRTEVMGLGLDTDITSDADRFRKKYNIDGPFIIYAGRKDSGKNVDTLLEYFSKYKKYSAQRINVYGVFDSDYIAQKLRNEPEPSYVDDMDYKEHMNADGRYDNENIIGIEVADAKADDNYYVFFPKYSNEKQLKLVLIGGGSIDIPEDIKEDVIDLGFVDIQDKYDACAAAALLCQPSKNESFSYVIMESWLCGRPVLVHEGCDVTRHFVKDSNGGLYFRNYFEFQEAVNFILHNPDVADKMADNGNCYVKEHFAWDVITKKYTEFFKMFD